LPFFPGVHQELRLKDMQDSSLKIEIDKVDKAGWDNLVSQFADASIYQTWPMASSSAKNPSSSHIVLSRGGEVSACCQLTLKRTPIINLGVADINWGPLCCKNGSGLDLDIFTQIIRAIKKEYGIDRGLLIRIWPHAKGENKLEVKSILESEGFKNYSADRPYRTFIMDISQPIVDLRSNLLQKWRNILNKAEKNNLEVIQGTGDDLFDKFLSLAKEMCERKDFQIGVDLNHYRLVQRDLPDKLKMQIMLCNDSGETIAGIVCSAIGDTGIYLLGASGNKALKTGASYLLQWNMIKHLREKGVHYYDLGCFNPVVNPGVFHFKQGLAGKINTDEVFIGQHNGCFSLKAQIARVIPLRQLLRARIGSWKEQRALKKSRQNS
jgi:Acetyltransferase (GNAT) domain